jgi:lysozyme family protein/peptidoglycan hydrolase-like protein with peptidoglycan-binding domain
VPWWFVGLCHYRESDLNFDTYLGNGQPLGMRTTIVPKGRGPFSGPDAFLDGAIDALRLEGFVGATDWSIARVLYRLEGFNGYGYHARGVNSPYLYGGSTCYGPPRARGGKFIADHVFDASIVDTQLGTAVILKSLMALDPSITFATGAPLTPVDQHDEPDDELAANTLWLQQSLNKLGVSPQLTEDGKLGPRTMAAVAQFQEQNGLQDTGIADAATIAAIQRMLTPSTPTPVVNVLMQRVAELEKAVGTQKANRGTDLPAGQVSSETGEAPQVQTVVAIAQKAAAPGMTVSGPVSSQVADQFFRDLMARIQVPANGSSSLGQVNGALGETLGNLLNGKKTAIGIIGALLTSLLSQVPSKTGFGQVLTLLTPENGLSQFAMPTFLALSAWGALGKLEKWTQGTAPPAQPAK